MIALIIVCAYLFATTVTARKIYQGKWAMMPGIDAEDLSDERFLAVFLGFFWPWLALIWAGTGIWWLVAWAILGPERKDTERD